MSKVRRTGAPDSHHHVLTPWTSRKEALLTSQAVSNPYNHCSPPEVWRHGKAGQHSSCLHKSINAAIRCQQLMTAPSTSALGKVPPKPSPAPPGSATTAAHAPCSPPTITDGLPSTPPGEAFPHHPFVCVHCEQKAANHPCSASCGLSRQDGFVLLPLFPELAVCVKPCYQH